MSNNQKSIIVALTKRFLNQNLIFVLFFTFFNFCNWFTPTSSAQLSFATYSNEFLKIGVGAQALGMSNAVVASTADVNSAYWNPAGLAQLKSNLEASFMHSEYFGGITKYDFGAIASRIDSNSVFAFSLIRLGVDNIPNTTLLIDPSGNINYDNITQFSIADYAFMFSYARNSKIPGLRIGANLKVVRRLIGDFGGAWGFGFDAAAQYDYKTWHFGAVLRDATTTFNAWSYNLPATMIATFQQTGNVLPSNSYEVTLPSLLLGASRSFKINNNFNLRAEVDALTTFDGERNALLSSQGLNIDPCIGIELGYKNLLFFRIGAGNYQRLSDINGTKYATVEPSIGVGIHYRTITLDYALANMGDQSSVLYSNVFSLKLAFVKHPHLTIPN